MLMNSTKAVILCAQSFGWRCLKGGVDGFSRRWVLREEFFSAAIKSAGRQPSPCTMAKPKCATIGELLKLKAWAWPVWKTSPSAREVKA